MACNTPDCGCVDCGEITQPTPPCTSCECNPGFCDNGDCEIYPQTQCATYNGDALPCTGIETGENLNQALARIDAKICDISGEGGQDKLVRVSWEDTTSGYLVDKIEEVLGNIEITVANPGENEKLVLIYNDPHLVRAVSDEEEAGYLKDKIALKEDPLGIVVPQPITNDGSKLFIGFTIDEDALCARLLASGCLNATPTCDTVLTGVSLLGSPNGDITATVGYTGATPEIFEVTVDGGQIMYFPTASFTMSGYAVGSHTVRVKGRCPNGVKTNEVSNFITVPAITVNCPSVSLTTTDSSIAAAWSTASGYSYTIELSLTEGGAPVQSGTSSTGSYIFNNLTSAVEYWVKVIPTYSGITKTTCLSQSAITTQTVCNATVGNLVTYNPTESGTVTVSWTGTGASSYDYRLDGSTTWISTSATSVALTGLSQGSHVFYIKSRCSNGLYGTSSQVNLTIPAATCTAVIDSLTVTNISENGTATATWTATGAASYEYRLGSTGSWVPTTATTVNLNNQSAGTHTIYVRTKCANGLYGGTSSATYVIPAPSCNATISNLTVSNQTSTGNCTISWIGTNAASYEYRLGAGSWIPTTATSVNLTNVADGTTVDVRGKCSNGLYGAIASTTINIPVTICSAPGKPVLSDVVSNTYQAQWTYTDTDPKAAIQAGTDNLSYQFSTSIALGSDLTCDFGAAANFQYLVTRIQVTEAVKTSWYNTQFNNGSFPDSVYYETFVKDGWTYYVTRDTFVFDAVSYAIIFK